MRRVHLPNLECDESLAASALELCEWQRQQLDQIIQRIDQFPEYSSVVIELGIRIQRWCETVFAMNRLGVGAEAHAIGRILIDLHLNQLAILHADFDATPFGGHGRSMTRVEKASCFRNFCVVEKLAMLKSMDPSNINRTEDEVALKVIEWQNYIDAKDPVSGLSLNPVIHRDARKDWHGLSLKELVSGVRGTIPQLYIELGPGSLLNRVDAFIPHFNKGLHASGVTHSSLWEESYIVDNRKPFLASSHFASFVLFGSLLAMAEGFEFEHVTRARIFQVVSTLANEE